jgi:hypothetical protein
MDINFVAGFGPIVSDPDAAMGFYGTALGITVETDAGYASTGDLDGVKQFGPGPRSGAAPSCSGTDVWPVDVPTPSAGTEFELGSPEAVDDAVAR